MLRFFIVAAGFFLCVSAHAGLVSLQKFRCQGTRVSGVVQIRTFDGPGSSEFYPLYQAVSNLVVNGRPVTLKMEYNAEYGKKPILFGKGAWKWDKSRRIYSLGGWELALDSLKSNLQLEVANSGRGIRGYLGKRSVERTPYDTDKYNFTCAAIK